MWLDYPARIPQTEEALLTVERRLRHRPSADRIKLLRLLKTRTVRSLRAAALLLGYSERQLQRWWDTYKQGGLEALARPRPRQGARERVSAEALAAVQGVLQAGQIGRLREAQAFLCHHYGIRYHSLNGISQLFQRHKIKLQTGRRRPRRGDPEAQSALNN